MSGILATLAATILVPLPTLAPKPMLDGIAATAPVVHLPPRPASA